jgi:tol-pal system protein YbgF
MRGCRWWAVALLAVTAAGCATRADLERVRREQRELRARFADGQVAVERLNRAVDTTREDESSKRDRAAIEALERRVGELETRFAQVQVQPVTDSSGEVIGAGLPRGVPRSQAAGLAWGREVERLRDGDIDPKYKRGLQLYGQGQSEESIRLLREFLRENPKSDLADNAQFWLGEAYYSQGDYNRSIIELNEVLLKYPQSDQIPGALLALATAFANSGDPIDARLILQKLISDHADTEEAKIGREQLQTLTGN